MTVNVSVPVVLDLINIYMNDGEKFDESKKDITQYISINAEFKNVLFNNNKFFGTFVSDPFFSYSKVINMSGEMSSDLKTIKWINFDLFYNVPTDYSSYWWVEEKMEIHLKLESIPIVYGSYNLQKSQVVALDYSKKRFEQRSHNRSDQNDEILIKSGVSQTTPLGGTISIMNTNGMIKNSVNISITNDGKEISSEIDNLLNDIIFFQTKTGICKFYERGEYFEKLLEEALLGTSNLADPNYALDIEKIMTNYCKELDLAIYISSEENKENKELINVTIDLVTMENKEKIKLSVKKNINPEFIMANISASVLNKIKNIQDKK